MMLVLQLATIVSQDEWVCRRLSKECKILRGTSQMLMATSLVLMRMLVKLVIVLLHVLLRHSCHG